MCLKPRFPTRGGTAPPFPLSRLRPRPPRTSASVLRGLRSSPGAATFRSRTLVPGPTRSEGKWGPRPGFPTLIARGSSALPCTSRGFRSRRWTGPNSPSRNIRERRAWPGLAPTRVTTSGSGWSTTPPATSPIIGVVRGTSFCVPEGSSSRSTGTEACIGSGKAWPISWGRTTLPIGRRVKTARPCSSSIEACGAPVDRFLRRPQISGTVRRSSLPRARNEQGSGHAGPNRAGAAPPR